MNMNQDYLKMFENMTSSIDFCKAKNRIDDEEVEAFRFGNEPETNKEESPSKEQVPIDESIHFQRFNKRYIHKYNNKEMAQIRLGCKNVIVNDYGTNDMFHMSDEEKLKNDQLAEIAIKLASVKSIYRRLDQYIEAMRIVYKAWEILSEKNYVHSKKEFFKLVGKGKIVSNRIIIPQMKNFNKYNKELIEKYISNPELDASIFAPEDKFAPLYSSDEDIEEEMTCLLTEEDYNNIQAFNENTCGEIEVEELPDKFMKNYLQPKYDKKKSYHQTVFNQIMNENRKVMTLGNQYIFSSAMFDKVKKESAYDKIKFKASWQNADDVDYYNMMIDEAYMNEPANKWSTNADEHLKMFYNEMDRAGLTWRQISINGNNSSSFEKDREKLSIKENKKLERDILNRIVEMNNNKKFKELSKNAEEKLNKFMEKGDDNT